MKKVMSLTALLAAVAMLVGCGECCGGKSPKKPAHKSSMKSDHKKKSKKSDQKMKSGDKKKPLKSQSEYQKFCSKCDHLLEDCKCYL